MNNLSPTPYEAAPAALLDDATVRRLARHCMAYRDPDDRLAAFQLATALLPFLGLCAVLLWSVSAGLWWPLVLAVPAGGFLVRLFGIQHDCGHNSFFSSRRVNKATGRFLSLLTLTPFGYWSRSHTLHHASAGDLGRRGIGDVDTLTVEEYRALSAGAKLRYRLYRHPLVLHVVGPPLYFVFFQRSPFGQALPAREAWRSIMALNVSMLLAYGGLALLVGPVTVLVALLPAALVASWVGGWLFFVQHQFEHTHWDESCDWNLQQAALGGSSYYVLPKVLQWFTGNIGLHHIHHLNSRVPNYRLQACLDAEPLLGSISRLSLGESLRCIGLSLWDTRTRRLVSFAAA
ncbi:fatty acid desaturase [Aurantimonas sp. Leaf443]|uniref:fatty acid desaturase n=1 Tax=Aurantimonas sp. Leaf443 TaxID=1736378 RepID=UPI000AB6AB01|nr:fatty acid desaturase [Aurantimonas sp. Leaf443]